MSNGDLDARRDELSRTYALLQNANKGLTDRINSILWAVLVGAITLIGVLGGLIYHSVDGRISTLELEAKDRTRMIDLNKAKNENQDTQIKDMRQDMRRLHP